MNKKNLLGMKEKMKENLLEMPKYILVIKEILLRIKNFFLGIHKYLLGMNKYLLGIIIGISIPIIIAIIVAVIVISVNESKKKKKKKVKFIVYMSVKQNFCRAKAYGNYALLYKPLQKLKRWARYKKNVKVTELDCDRPGDSDQCIGYGRRNYWPEIFYFVDGEKKGTRYGGKRTFRKMKEFIKDIAKS